ncbi:ABC transporter type 1, transmembrane domain-containing protein [Mycena galericulata]|nr:ABC transporter type 1, transmembrane domain-containing protein [Mycena galericulata]
MLFSNPFHPPPAPPGFATHKILPEDSASYLSQLVVHWLSPFLEVGFSRPLEKEGKYRLQNQRQNFYPRCPREQRPAYFHGKSEGEVNTETASDGFLDEKKGDASESKDKSTETPRRFWQRKPKKQFDSSLFRAVHNTFFWRIWTGGLFKLLSGIGLACALFVMQAMMVVGLSTRTGIIGSVFRKSLRLSGRARLEHTVGQTTTIISTDATRLDKFCQVGHNVWVAPIQIAIGIGLLISNMGYSALVGLGVLILGFPMQVIFIVIMIKQRKKGAKITDTRVRLSSEVLQGIRLIKYYAWESFYAHQLGDLQAREIATVRKAAMARSALMAQMQLTPVLASVLSIDWQITYALSGHELNVAVIFSSLQLFNIIRAPLTFLPLVLSGLSDAIVAFSRIGNFLTAEELPEPYLIDGELKNAVEVDASFAWETAGKLEEPEVATDAESGPGGMGGGGRGGKGRGKKGKKGKDAEKGDAMLPTTADQGTSPSGTATPGEELDKPFELKNLKLSVPRSAFVAIVGRVGSGKRCGKQRERFRQVIRACQLEHDLELLPHGEETEARVSLARAAYSKSEVALLDGPLSAVDSFVGKAILDECILHGPLAGRTRILVTHSLHVLDKTDYIYVMDNGTIEEEGTYKTLMKDGIVFSRLMEDYGNLENESETSTLKGKRNANRAENEAVDPKQSQLALMQTEERMTGAVSWETYSKYLKFAGGMAWVPIIIALLTLGQAASVSSNMFLGFWTAGSIKGFHQGQYMGVYAALGFAQALFYFFSSFAFASCPAISHFLPILPPKWRENEHALARLARLCPLHAPAPVPSPHPHPHSPREHRQSEIKIHLDTRIPTPDSLRRTPTSIHPDSDSRTTPTRRARALHCIAYM